MSVAVTPLSIMPWNIPAKAPTNAQRVYDVLVLLPNLTPDEICVRAKLTPIQVEEALRLLREKGLIQCKRQQPRYSLTAGATRPTDMRGRRCAPKKK